MSADVVRRVSFTKTIDVDLCVNLTLDDIDEEDFVLATENLGYNVMTDEELDEEKKQGITDEDLLKFADLLKDSAPGSDDYFLYEKIMRIV